jgi:hypothetical protein
MGKLSSVLTAEKICVNLFSGGKPSGGRGIRISSLRFSNLKAKRGKPYWERLGSLCSNEFWNTFSQITLIQLELNSFMRTAGLYISTYLCFEFAYDG